VEDAALMLVPLFVRDKKGKGPVPANTSSFRARRPCLGIPKEFFLEVLDAEVRAAFEGAVRTLKKHGAQIKEISLPQLQDTEEAGNQIAWVEATMYHQQAGWFPEHISDYSEDVYKRLEMGTKVTAVDYLRARATRKKFQEQLLGVFSASDLDAFVVPTTPIAAPLIGEGTVRIDGTSYLSRALLLRLNRPANLAGVPAISVPCGLTKGGLPIGLQFIAAWTEEPLLLEIARNFERESSLTSPPGLRPLD
jgi:aspartyl-tRNA(Asn)/glutamyl-tRNA(Gln) amidotransferase subunit A